MHLSTQRDSRSPFFFSGTTTRAATGPHDRSAQPPLTSGFGAVLEKEHELQSAIAGHLAPVSGPKADDLDRILRSQQSRIGANIALLEQRYEMLPHPERFQALHGVHFSPTQAPPSAGPDSPGSLPDLVARHQSLIGDIDALITRGADGQRGELILLQIGRNHEDMAGVLTALLREDDSVRDLEPVPVTAAASPTPGTTEGGWENEGGAPRATRAPISEPAGAS